jgi:NAD dependent epimerase/dehydratase family enzyme
VVNLLFGEMGRTVLLEGARVLPAKLASIRFEFRHPTLESAIRAELGRERVPEGWGEE